MPGKEDTIAGILFILLAVAFLSIAWSFPSGTQDGVPGPGYFPIILSILLIVLSIAMIIIGIIKKTRFNFLDSLFKANMATFLLVNTTIIAYLALWNSVHFMLNTSALLIVLGMIFRRSLVGNLIFSVVATTILYMLFNNVFHVML